MARFLTKDLHPLMYLCVCHEVSRDSKEDTLYNHTSYLTALSFNKSGLKYESAISLGIVVYQPECGVYVSHVVYGRTATHTTVIHTQYTSNLTNNEVQVLCKPSVYGRTSLSHPPYTSNLTNNEVQVLSKPSVYG